MQKCPIENFFQKVYKSLKYNETFTETQKIASQTFVIPMMNIFYQQVFFIYNKNAICL